MRLREINDAPIVMRVVLKKKSKNFEEFFYRKFSTFRYFRYSGLPEIPKISVYRSILLNTLESGINIALRLIIF